MGVKYAKEIKKWHPDIDVREDLIDIAYRHGYQYGFIVAIL